MNDTIILDRVAIGSRLRREVSRISDLGAVIENRNNLRNAIENSGGEASEELLLELELLEEMKSCDRPPGAVALEKFHC